MLSSSHFTSSAAAAAGIIGLPEEYPIGSYCRAVWEVDYAEYEGQVIDIIRGGNGYFAIVRFIGFGNAERVELNKLKPSFGKIAQDLQRVAASAYDCEMVSPREQEQSNDNYNNDNVYEDEALYEEEVQSFSVQQQRQDNFNDNGVVYFNEDSAVPEPNIICHDAKSTSSASASSRIVVKIKPPYMNENFIIGFVGTGETLKNIAFPLIAKGALNPANVIVFGMNEDYLKPWEDYLCQTSTNLAALLTYSNIIIWSCNQRNFQNFCNQALRSATKMNPNSLHVTLIGDLSLEDFKNQLMTSFQILQREHMVRTARIVTLIFNKMDRTKTASLYIPGSEPREILLEEEEIILKMFGQSRMFYEINETQINGYRGLIQNGMSLMFPVVETLSDCGLKVGISRNHSTQIVSRLMASATASILSQPNNNLQEIKDVILQPCGSSIVGVLELEKSGVRSSYINAFNAMIRKENDLNASKRMKRDNS